MSLIRVLFIALIAFLSFQESFEKPTTKFCFGNEDDCLDAAMHPRLSVSHKKRSANGEDTNSYWFDIDNEYIHQQETQKLNTKKAKNIIFFIGDGMGLTTIAAARSQIGGEERQLAFESFPFTGLAKTYSVDKIVPDSASTATAFLCGIKANYGTIGVNANVERENCNQNDHNNVYSIAKWAIDSGKAAGFVTTARVTDATPAGVYAQTAERDWESDSDVVKSCGKKSGIDDIAYQLIHGDVGSKLKVALGGGRKMFLDTKYDKKGQRSDGRNLITEFEEQSSNNQYVETVEELMNVDVDKTDRLLGLFDNGHFDYYLEQLANEKNTQPTLEEMTRKAIELLENEKNGYFLFVEGAKIDVGHHKNKAKMALSETVELSKAVDVAKQLTNDDDTLIVVSADHSHVFSLAGYQSRETDIYDVAPLEAEDEKNYLSLSYANGPGFDLYYNTAKYERRDPENVITIYDDTLFPATVPMKSETHGGEDVAVYANGPWSHLFTGVYEQNVIPHIMAYAACIGDGLTAC